MDGGGDAPQYSTLSTVNTQDTTNQQTENRQALETLINLQNSFLSNFVSGQQAKSDSTANQGPCVIYYTGPDGELLQGVEQGIPVSQVSAIPSTQIQTVPTIQVQNVNIAVPVSTATVLQNVTPSTVTQQAGLVPLGANMAAAQLNAASVTYVTGSEAGVVSGTGDGLVTIPEGGMVSVPISCIAPASNSGMVSVLASSMASAQSEALSNTMTSSLTSTPASARTSSSVSTSGVITNQALSSVRTYTPIAPAPSVPRVASSLASETPNSQFAVNVGSAGNPTVITSIVDTAGNNVEASVVVGEVVQLVEKEPSSASNMQREEEKKRCHVCEKVFCSSQSMLRHLRVLHGVETGPFHSKCAVPGCSASYRCVRELVTHYSAVHQANVEVEDLTFDSVDQFMTWKRQEEAVTGAKFPKSTGSSKSSKTHQYLYFSCHRNGSSENIGVSSKPSSLSNHSSSNKRPAALQRQITRINEDIVRLQTHLSSDKVDKAQANHIETVLQSLLLHCGLEEDRGNLKRKNDVGDGSKMKKAKTFHVCEKCGMPSGMGRRRVGRKPGRKPKQQQTIQEGNNDPSCRQEAQENPYARPTQSLHSTLRSQRFQRRRNKIESKEETEHKQDAEVEAVIEPQQQPTEITDRVSSDEGKALNTETGDQQEDTTSSTTDRCEDSGPSEHLASALLELASHSQQST
uniref:C2H2-type domain-containing protein n=1 Tax=Branchiostoma floridae TaxID=7739 RepID=C3YI19_BRAFL|eukprot:XP_002604145.1 hypothetical protein BRAFLDRAFT_119764 [Branchiostoma floridae]